MLTVHLRINDAATGQPTPARLCVTGPQGEHYAPLGRFTEFPTGRNEDVGGHLRLRNERWFPIDGSCEMLLPPGMPLRIQAHKGPEFRPLDHSVTLGLGQMAIRLSLARWYDSAQDGWMTGDGRCHFLSPHAAALEGAAEGLDFINLLACVQQLASEDGIIYPTVPNLLAFSGQTPALIAHHCTVAVNTLNSHPVLGRVALLHTHRPVFPLTFGGEDDTDDWSICDWCDQGHRKNGLTVWVDAFEDESGLAGGEALVAVVLGKMDAVEVTPRRKHPLLPWVYRLWDAGFPLRLLGSSGKVDNRVPVGSLRTYARFLGSDTGTHPPLPEIHTRWIDAVRAGHTFVTNGPILLLSQGEHEPGSVLELSRPEETVRLTAVAKCPHPFEKLELLQNGQVIAASETSRAEDLYQAELDLCCRLSGRGWMAARCWGTGGAMLDPGVPPFAHTSPLWYRSPDQRGSVPAHSVRSLRILVERSREWVEAHGRFRNEKRRRQLLDHHDRALARLEEILANASPGPA